MCSSPCSVVLCPDRVPLRKMGSEETASDSSVDLTRRMRFESSRLSTFRNNWPPDAPVEARKVAKAGLFRSSEADSATSVRCPWCQCVLDGWQYGEQVRRKFHIRKKPVKI